MPGITINFPNAPLESVLDFYGELVGRTILRAPTLQATSTINLKARTPLTREEARQALDTVLALNNVSMIPMGDKFVTAVPVTQALQEANAFSSIASTNLPEAAQFMTEIVQLTNALPSEVVASIQPFAKVPGGIVPIDSSQVLVIRDYAINIKRMLEVIQKIDVALPSDYQLEVIPIKYGRVEDIVDVMSGLVSGAGGGGGAGASSSRTRSTASRTSGSRLSMRSSSQQQQQRGMYPGQPVQQTQPQAATGAQTDFQRRLQQIVNRAAGGEDLLVDAKIIPDARANSLVVYANKHDLSILTNIVSKLDVMLAQVLIEAVIIDVNLKDNLSFGLSAVQSQLQSGNWTFAGGMANAGIAAPTAGGTFSNLLGGLTYWTRYRDDLDIVVRAIADKTEATVLQRPRIQTTHAVTATFNSGSQIAYSAGTYYGYGTGANSYAQFLDVGIMLEVTPYITPDGLVVMEIAQEISELAGYTEISPGQQAPNTNTRSASSTVSVRDGETILLGGFIRTSKSRSNSGIPLLKDIPLLGPLFRSNSKNNDRSELLVLLRPKILLTPQDASLNAKQELESSPSIQQAKDDFEAQERELIRAMNERKRRGR